MNCNRDYGFPSSIEGLHKCLIKFSVDQFSVCLVQHNTASAKLFYYKYIQLHL